MSEKSFLLQMVTPAQIIYQQEAKKISLRTLEGRIAILPFHQPLVSVVSPGEVRVTESGGKSKIMAVSEGIIEVKDNRVRILLETADRVEELDKKKILEAKKAAEELIERAKKEGLDEKKYAVLRTSLQREMARLRVCDRHRGRRSLQ